MADLGHGRGWLNDAPAASIRRIDAQIGHPLQITEAGRTWAQQNAHWLTYQRNGWPIALHPDTPSVHQLGAAVDSDEAQRILPIMTAHGWVRTVYRNGVLVEPWHFEYDPARDKHRNRPASGGATKPAAPTTPDQSEEDEMKNCGVYYEKSKNTWVYLVFNTGSGWFHEFSNGTNAGPMPSEYNNALATALDTKTWAKVTPGHANVIKQGLAAVQRTQVSGSLSVDIADA